MSVLDSVDELKQALSGIGVKNVFGYAPNQVTPPCIIIQGSDPLISIPDEQVFGSTVVVVNLIVSFVSHEVDTAKATKHVYNTVDKIMVECANLGWAFSVSPLYSDTNPDYKKYLAVDVFVANTFVLED